mmetsp:Transcript_12803/g.40998  ORF Transcript_12803/g.40998 Transcript_12803/m.40998 type:complete len:315 (+) Transcript_12803:91-1035(+)
MGSSVPSPEAPPGQETARKRQETADATVGSRIGITHSHGAARTYAAHGREPQLEDWLVIGTLLVLLELAQLVMSCRHRRRRRGRRLARQKHRQLARARIAPTASSSSAGGDGDGAEDDCCRSEPHDRQSAPSVAPVDEPKDPAPSPPPSEVAIHPSTSGTASTAEEAAAQEGAGPSGPRLLQHRQRQQRQQRRIRDGPVVCPAFGVAPSLVEPRAMLLAVARVASQEEPHTEDSVSSEDESATPKARSASDIIPPLPIPAGALTRASLASFDSACSEPAADRPASRQGGEAAPHEWRRTAEDWVTSWFFRDVSY